MASDLLKSFEGFKRHFLRVKTDAERVAFAWKKLQEGKLFLEFVGDEKSDGEAENFRKLGDLEFVKKDYIKALIFYNRSIASAESRAFLANSFANRSAVLFRLGLHKECIVDVKRAISHGYPAHKTPNLLNRLATCEQRLRPTPNWHENPPEINDHHKNISIQSAADFIKIETSEKYGRHVIAARNIRIGEVLVVEKPYMCDVRDEELLHCDCCAELSYNLIPCDNCTQVLYCGESCKDNSDLHKYVCPILKSCNGQDGDIDYRLLRLPLKLTLAALKEVSVEDEKDDVFRSDRYEEVRSLQTHSEKRNPKMLFVLSVTAAQAFHLVQNFTEFEMVCLEREFQDLILRNIQICDVNNVALMKRIITTKKDALCESKPSNYGNAVYSLKSLFNHSCCPNVTYTLYGSTLVLHAIRTIKKGEQCFITYSYRYYLTERDVRQRELKKKYHFACSCQACVEDWKSYTDIPSVSYSWQDTAQTNNLLKGDVRVARLLIPKLVEELKRLEKWAPNSDLNFVESRLLLCYRILGNKRVIHYCDYQDK